MEALKVIAAKGENPEITTEAGLKCIQSIRKTMDKSGRIVCTFFEKLPPKTDTEYYRITRLPISLETIEQGLNEGKYNSMTEVESDLKRMVQNAKEQHNKRSQIFEDAERVRKAVSNYMVKHNPAYLDPDYSAFATPFPPSDDEEMNDADEGNAEKMNVDQEGNSEEVDDNAGQEEEEEVKVLPKRRGRPPRSSNTTTNVSSTRHSTRTPNKKSLSVTPTLAPLPKRTDDELMESKSYKGLLFQEAQEKIVEEMLRKEEDGYDGPYFEAFINLPPRELKDYYQVIAEPLSLKKMKKNIQGFQNKKVITGVTPYKSWKAFEEKASLLWNNAYYYNEEGSEIYELAKELEKFFYEQLKEAKTCVVEPVQSTSTKVILKSRTPAPATQSKIILHSGRKRRDESPASPVSSRGRDTKASLTPVPTREKRSRRATPTAGSTRGASVAARDEEDEEGEKEDAEMEDAERDGEEDEEEGNVEEKEVMEEPPKKKLKPVTLTRYPGKTVDDAILQRVTFQTINVHGKPHQLVVKAHPVELRQHHAYHLDGSFLNQRMRIIPKPLASIFKNRFVKFYVAVDKASLEPTNYVDAPTDFFFETVLHRGVNTIEIHYIAGPPEGETLPDEARYEVEVVTATFNVYSAF